MGSLKISVWTIVLIIISLFLISQTVMWYSDKSVKWDKCEVISNTPERVSIINFSLNDNSLENKFAFGQWHSHVDDFRNCLDSYTDVWTFAILYKWITIIFIVLIALSWRTDNLKR